MALWQRVKRFSRSVVILAVGCLVLEQIWYSVVVPGYFFGVLVSPVFWGLFAAVCFYLLWRFDPEFVKEVFKEVFKEENPSLAEEFYTTSDFMSPNHSPHDRLLIRGY